MKFIFPQNYHFQGKILGFLDYRSAILCGIFRRNYLSILTIFSLYIFL